MNNRSDLLENRKHSTALVHYSYYEGAIPELFPYVTLHFHDEWELNYIREGKGLFRIDNRSVYVKKGDIILLPPHLVHGVESDQRMAYDTVVFHQDMLGGNDDRSTLEYIQPVLQQKMQIKTVVDDTLYYQNMKQITEEIISLALDNTAIGDLRMKGLLLFLFWYLWKSESIIPVDSKYNGLDLEIKEAIEYIHEHYDEELKIEHLAGLIHMSDSHFMHKFQSKVGCTVMEYLNQIRIQKVCENLLTNSDSIAAIAFASGFRNLSNFNRQFKKVMGCSPSVYRKTKQK